MTLTFILLVLPFLDILYVCCKYMGVGGNHLIIINNMINKNQQLSKKTKTVILICWVQSFIFENVKMVAKM